MIDTFMALWNQDRRKRAVQVILTFFLMCIGISLLFILTNRAILSQHQHQKASLGSTNPTVPTFGNTVVPNLTPTISVAVGTQPTPGTTTTQPTQVATNTTQPTSVATTTQPTQVATTQPTPGTTMQPTPGATTQPCVATPSSATSQISSLKAGTRIQQQSSSPTPTPKLHSGTSTPGIPLKHFDGGGGPIYTNTPVPPTPTPALQSTPGSQHGGGWVPDCTTSDSISAIVGSDMLTPIAQNIWLILGSSLLGTTIFYRTLFALKRRRTNA